MAKDKITDYDSNASLNTDVGGVNLQESSMLPSEVNNAIREVMSHQKEAFGSGTPLFVDQTNNMVGIGTTVPHDLFSVKGASGASTDINFSGGDDTNDIRLFFGGDSSPFNGTIVYEPDTNNMHFKTSGTEKVRITSGGLVGIGTSSPSSFNGGANNLVVGTGSGSEGITIFAANDSNSAIFFADGDSTTTGQLNYQHASNAFTFHTNGGTERMRIVDEGLLINCTSTLHSGVERSLEVENHSGSGFVAIFKGNTASHETVCIHNSATSGTRILLAFKTDGSTGTIVGRVTSDGSTTNYATSSDYRLKENVTYDFDATTRLKQLKPARFNWIADEDNTTVDGFIAHEVSSIVPEAVSGEKDAVDADGNIDPQGIDQSKLVPLLVKTIQELEARITALEGA